MTKETKTIIDKNFEELLNSLEPSILIGVTKNMLPNDKGYYSELDNQWKEAIHYLRTKISNYIEI